MLEWAHTLAQFLHVVVSNMMSNLMKSDKTGPLNNRCDWTDEAHFSKIALSLCFFLVCVLFGAHLTNVINFLLRFPSCLLVVFRTFACPPSKHCMPKHWGKEPKKPRKQMPLRCYNIGYHRSSENLNHEVIEIKGIYRHGHKLNGSTLCLDL